MVKVKRLRRAGRLTGIIFIIGLFNNALNSSDYVPAIDKMISVKR
jgi:hypothetical protein